MVFMIETATTVNKKTVELFIVCGLKSCQINTHYYESISSSRTLRSSLKDSEFL